MGSWLIGQLGAGVPVVHEDIWLPESRGRNPDIRHVAILRLVPPQVRVCPLLDKKVEKKIIFWLQARD